MPELPEVQTVVDTLRPALVGATLADVRLRRRDIVHPPTFDLAHAIEGQRVASVRRRGKRIVIELENASTFYFHLGMTGRLTIEPTTARSARHTHMRCTLDDGETQLRFCDPRRFGGIWWCGSTGSDASTLGPEPLQLRPRQLAMRLRSTRRAIKTALLDQRVIAGLGNIYADEALFAAGIHPLRLSSELSWEEIRSLNRAIKSTLRRAIRNRGSTLRDYVDANGSPGSFSQFHCVYGKEGSLCARCRTMIRRLVVNARSTHYCPICQPVWSAR